MDDQFATTRKLKTMNKEELLGKELSNLYAISKQVNHYFNGSDISFLSERIQQLLMKYVKFSCNNEERVSESLRSLNINPGNTKDSIVQEIIENLNEIATQKEYAREVREMGFIMSLNRLISYHMANINNLDFRSRDM